MKMEEEEEWNNKVKKLVENDNEDVMVGHNWLTLLEL